MLSQFRRQKSEASDHWAWARNGGHGHEVSGQPQADEVAPVVAVPKEGPRGPGRVDAGREVAPELGAANGGPVGHVIAGLLRRLRGDTLGSRRG